jgi:hypothetical protein
MVSQKPAFAGIFYPEDSDELTGMIKTFMEEGGPLPKEVATGKVRAIIVPHAGYVYSGAVAGFGYAAVKDGDYSKAVVIGPSHQLWFRDLAYCPCDEAQTPVGNVRIVQPDPLSEMMQPATEAFHQEHSLEVQLPFIKKSLKDCPCVLLVTGEISNPEADAEAVRKLVTNDTLLIISSDLSHYHDYQQAQGLDTATISEILNLEGIEQDQACGAAGIGILIRIAQKKNWKPVLLNYRNSGDTAGSKNEVVGYAAIAFIE